jgi:hypothetical protein
MSSDIFATISDKADSLLIDDLEGWVATSLTEYYDKKLQFLAKKAYGYSADSLSISSFKASAKEEIKSALETFFIKKEYWKSGRELDPYLRVTLNRLGQRRQWEVDSKKMRHYPVCPICREEGNKEVLQPEDGMLRCNSCTSISTRLKSDIKTSKADIFIQCKYNVHSKFALHSKKGYKCKDCSRFMPESIGVDGHFICPYDDCIFSGPVTGLKPKTHPTVTKTDRSMTSIIGTSIGNSKPKDPYYALTDKTASTDAALDLRDKFENELKVLLSVIDDQLKRVERTNSKATSTQKRIMYKAFKKMVNMFPVEMVGYLVYRKQKSDFPIQAKIFQVYAELVENYMPFTITKGGVDIDIFDVTSPDLSLFNGVSEYESKVRDNNTIPNETKEEYIGGRNFKNYGPCFIGKIIDIIDTKTGKSIKDDVASHSFSQINMNKTVEPGTAVKVIHYRILSHYEIDSLVFLQRTRRAVVDSVHFRLNNKKREVGKK